ncbi:unnamed protein product [Leuciscus chuanchicus]
MKKKGGVTLPSFHVPRRQCDPEQMQWFIIQASERARLSQKRHRAKKESTCATSLRPTLLRTPRAICTSSNENSIIEESRRLREKSVSSSGKKSTWSPLTTFAYPTHHPTLTIFSISL